MISHKRKHDRQDGEQAYQQFKSKQEDTDDTISLDATPLPTSAANSNSSNSTTPLSSLSAEHFLARKRGRPPKKIVSACRLKIRTSYFIYDLFPHSNCPPMHSNRKRSV